MQSIQIRPNPIDGIPSEIWVKILADERISAVDIANLSLVSQKLKWQCTSNVVWKHKFVQQFAQTFELMEAQRAEDWVELYKLRLVCSQAIKQHLDKLSAGALIAMANNNAQLCRLQNKTRFVYSYNLLTDIQRPTVFQHPEFNAKLWQPFMMGELRAINMPKDSNLLDVCLTERFYAKRILRIVVHDQIASELKNWVEGDQTDLEAGYCLLFQWFRFNLHLPTQSVASVFVKAAERTTDHLTTINATHRATTATQFTHINYTPQEKLQVIQALNYVFTHKFPLNFVYKGPSLYRMCIRMREIIKVTSACLCIKYMCVANRLGIKCNAVFKNGIYKLKVLLDINYFRSPAHWAYINVMQKCTLKVYDNQLDVNRKKLGEKPATNLKLLMEMCSGLGDWTSVLPLEFHGKDNLEALAVLKRPGTILHLTRLYIDAECNYDIAWRMLQELDVPANSNFDRKKTFLLELLNENPRKARRLANNWHESLNPQPMRPKCRSIRKHSKVQYYVGMVVTPRTNNNDDLGVITDWDLKQQFVKHFGTGKMIRLQDGATAVDKPHYCVLFNDQSSGYGTEEQLAPAIGKCYHWALGMHFDEFCGTHYTMNKFKLDQYPDDHLARHNFPFVYELPLAHRMLEPTVPPPPQPAQAQGPLPCNWSALLIATVVAAIIVNKICRLIAYVYF